MILLLALDYKLGRSDGRGGGLDGCWMKEFCQINQTFVTQKNQSHCTTIRVKPYFD